MRYRILGRLQVHGVDRLEPREQRVMAVLLLSPNTLITREQLIDAVWQDDPPATVRRQMLNCVARLRRRVGAGVIHSDGLGYRIEVASGQLDAQIFGKMLEEAAALQASGQAAPAVHQLRQALQLWRGPALAGLPGRHIEAAASRLEEQRLGALERCYDLELALGRHGQVVGELTEFAAAHPLRERGVALLITALRRCGRQAEALAVYRELGRRLADELGIDPSPQLQQLHGSILRGEKDPPEPEPAPSAAMPRQLPAAIRYFVGRAAELKDLDQLLDNANPATVMIATIEGSAGVGKTALAVQWAHRVADRFPDGQLYIDLRGYDPGTPTEPAAAIRRFMDALGVAPQRVPADIDGQMALFRSTLAGRRLLVLLDNARDAQQVRPLLPSAPGCVAVVTSRDPLLGLVAANGAIPVSLDVMSTSEAHDLLSQRLGADRMAAEPGAATEIIACCARLPLALAIAAARAIARPRLTLTALAADLRDSKGRLEALSTNDPATDLRAVFSWSYRSLGRPAARLFRLLGLHPTPDIGLPAAASLAGSPRDTARLLLAELVRVQLATEPGPGRYTMHDLFRSYAAGLCTTPEAHAAARRMFDHYLHTAYAAALLISPGRTPIPLLQASAGSEPEDLADDSHALSWLNAEQHVLLAAIDQAGLTAYPQHALDLAWSITTFLHRQGRWHDLAQTQQVALNVATSIGDRPRQAHTHRIIGFTHGSLGLHASSRAHLAHALGLYKQLADDDGAAMTHHALAMASEREGDFDEALMHALASHALHRSSGSRRGQANALNLVGWYHTRLGQPSKAIEPCRAAIAIHQSTADHAGEAAAWDTLGNAYHRLGDHHTAADCLRRALPLQFAGGELYGQARSLDLLGDAYLAAGNPAAAHESWRHALTILDDLQHPETDQLRRKLT